MTHPTDTKTALRNQMRARRKAARAALPQAGLDAATVFMVSRITDALAPGAVVAGYWPMGSEIDPRPLMAALYANGHSLCLPIIPEPEGALAFRAWAPGTPVEPHGFGTQAPKEDGSPPVVPNLLIVPLLAFDRRGGRLGYGKGHYDRTIAALGRVTTVGLAFSDQETEAVPMEAHDVSLRWIVTDREAIPCVSDGNDAFKEQ